MTVRVYTPPGKAEEGRFSLQVATDALDLYDDFFAIPYPLPKLDMVREIDGCRQAGRHRLTSDDAHNRIRWPSPSSRWAPWRTGAW